MKFLRILMLTSLILTSIPGLYARSTPVAYAEGTDWSFISPDIDGDGLPNDVEELGWCNGVGCFVTNPFDPDSDNDGLTDGEEKLFDSDPHSDASPGVYVIYDDALKTRQYYPWQPYGHKMIARADTFTPPRPDDIDASKGFGVNLDAVVVRRGATFYVGGPIGASLQISKSKDSLSSLTAVQDPHNRLWKVTVPSNGTAGKYTLTLGDDSLDLFVIFELPTPSGELTQLGIEKFLYDDDSGKNYDEIAQMLSGQSQYEGASGTTPNPVTDWWLNDNPHTYPPYDIPSEEYMVEGGTYDFRTQQFNRYIMEEYVIDAINGVTNQKDAAQKLNEKVDASTAFRNLNPFYDSWRTLKAIETNDDLDNQCSNISGAVAALVRAAGIPSRVLFTDWNNSTFDHANEIWINGEWRAYRGYDVFELVKPSGGSEKGTVPLYNGLCKNDHSKWPGCGALSNYSRSQWGQEEYRPTHSGGSGPGNIIATVNETWSDNDSLRSYRWPSWIKDGNKEGVSMVKKEYFETVHVPYWGSYGWTQEPVVTEILNSKYDDWPTSPGSGLLSGFSVSTTAPAAGNGLDYQSPEVQVGQVVAEQRLDSNGNGQYDQLILQVEMTASQPGPYWVRGELSATEPVPGLAATGGAIADAYQQVQLVAGTQIVELAFSGTSISLKRANGPYVLNGVWVLDGGVDSPGPTDFMNDSLALRARLYTTAAYQSTDFETHGALLSNSYRHSTLDADGNGKSDALLVTTALQVFEAGEYTVAGTLYDANDNFVSRATWSGTGSDVSLQFNDLAGTVGPYTLRDLELQNSEDRIIDQLTDAYTIELIPELVTSAVASLSVYGGEGVSAFSATPTSYFSDSLVDGNLKVDVGISVSELGSYKIEAWLADVDGNLVTWASGQPAQLPAGVHTLSIIFEGENIQAHGVNGPYKVVALKILDGTATYNVLDTVDVALTTKAYTLNQFAASEAHVIFADYVENGPGLWSAGAPWAIKNEIHQYMGPSEAWHANNANASLRLASPLNLSTVTNVTLKFLTSYQFVAAGDKGYIEASTDGNSWNIVTTFSGRKSWSDEPQVINLSGYGGKSTVHLRFRLGSAGGVPNDGWYIDDIVIIGIADADGDNIPNDEEGDGDSDGDGIPDFQDTDSDNDGIPDKDEGADDTDGDGIPDYRDTDSDNDTIPDANEWTPPGKNLPFCVNLGLDTDGDGIPNCRDNDVDGDDIPNYLDTDSDGDGKNDKDEVGNPNSPKDSDGDFIPDYYDSDPEVNEGPIVQPVYLPFIAK